MSTVITIVFIAAVIAFILWKTGVLDSFVNPKNPFPAKPADPVKPAPIETGELDVKYDTEEALKAFLKKFPGVGMVTLDGEQINGGFAPAANFITQMDGSVRR